MVVCADPTTPSCLVNLSVSVLLAIPDDSVTLVSKKVPITVIVDSLVLNLYNRIHLKGCPGISV